MTRPVVAITIGTAHYTRMMSRRAWEELERFSDVVHHPGDAPAAKEDLLTLLPNADACLTSWDVARLDADVVSSAPKLRAIVHMGGSVKRVLSDAVWERGILVISTAPVLAEHVAETTLGLMIVGMKRIWPLGQRVREGGWRDSPYWPSRELCGKRVGIVGASNVGRHVIKLLQPFHVHILLYDPYVSEEEARGMGAAKVELDELVREADVISLHAPALPATYHMIDARRLSMMRDDVLLINTARGTLIDEEALVRELEKGRFFAFLDVTDPEPPAPDSPLRRLPNVVVTPHIAGCIENCTRMGERAVEELRRFFAGEPPLNPITPDILDRVA